jgi:hypothetical protein
MSGRVFHQDRHELHGITVVLETHSSKVYVGRFDSQDERGVHMHDVGVYDAAAGASKADFLRRCDKFGIMPQHKDLLVPTAEVSAIERLVDAVR